MIHKTFQLSFFCCILLTLFSCSDEKKAEEENLKNTDWNTIEEKASGSTVNFMMWQGSPVINDYINNYVIATDKEIINELKKLVSKPASEPIIMLQFSKPK